MDVSVGSTVLAVPPHIMISMHYARDKPGVCQAGSCVCQGDWLMNVPLAAPVNHWPLAALVYFHALTGATFLMGTFVT